MGEARALGGRTPGWQPSRALPFAAAGLVLAALAGVAEGRCRSVMDCSRGACVMVEACDSALDPRASPPPGSPPSPRRITPEAPTVGAPPPRLLPPPGTGSCRPMHVCVAGRCAWETVCN